MCVYLRGHEWEDLSQLPAGQDTGNLQLHSSPKTDRDMFMFGWEVVMREHLGAVQWKYSAICVDNIVEPLAT